MACSRPWSSISPPAISTVQAAAVEDEDAVREADDLGQLGGAEQDRPAAVGELADEQVDLALGPDVDAARRVVEQEDVRCDLEPLAEDDLLLVAAGQPADDRVRAVRLDAQRLDLATRGAAHARDGRSHGRRDGRAPTATWAMLHRDASARASGPGAGGRRARG